MHWHQMQIMFQRNARRNDKNIMKMHLEMLDDKNTISLYKTITDMIKDKYELKKYILKYLVKIF